MCIRDRYWPKVHNFSRLYLSSIAEVEEVVQEVFVKLWEARIFLKENESFKGFLFIITRNIIFNQFRKSFNENAYKTTVLSSAEVEYDIENEMDAADLQGYIKKLISELTPRQQEVFHLSRCLLYTSVPRVLTPRPEAVSGSKSSIR